MAAELPPRRADHRQHREADRSNDPQRLPPACGDRPILRTVARDPANGQLNQGYAHAELFRGVLGRHG